MKVANNRSTNFVTYAFVCELFISSLKHCRWELRHYCENFIAKESGLKSNDGCRITEKQVESAR